MMWKEFEELAGYEVSFKDYSEIIEPMYMATNLSKSEFVKVIDRKRFALKSKKQIISQMKKLANSLMETCDHYTDWDAKKQIEALLDEYKERFWPNTYLMTKTTCEHYRGCSFPAELVCYDNKDMFEIERITLATPWYEA